MDTVENLYNISKRIVTDFGTPLIGILICSVLITAILFLASWYLTKRQLSKNSENIPGGVIKNYLDSIINESITLRSSIFREKYDKKSAATIAPMHAPSPPTNQDDTSSGLQQIKEQLSERDKTITELKSKLHHNQSQQADELKKLNHQINQLKQKLAAPPTPTPTQEKESSKEQDSPQVDLASEDPSSDDTPKVQEDIIVEYQDEKSAKNAKAKGDKQEKEPDQKLIEEFEQMLS